MTSPTLVSDEATIVLLGSFNPAIFTPDWLGRNRLLPEKEVEATKIKIMVPQATILHLPWGLLQAEQNRFEVRATSREHFEPLRDLMVGIFKLLEHTPFNQMGLNRVMQFRMPSEEEWHRLGHTLVPKTVWKEVVENPGMLSLRVRGKRRGVNARVDTTVEPVFSARNGIVINTNEHHPETGDLNRDDLLSELAVRWEPFLDSVQTAASRILREGTVEGSVE